MDWIVLLSTVVLIILLAFVFNRKSSFSKNPPPGILGLPILGCLPFIKPRLFIYLQTLGKQYGPIFTIKVGERHLLILNSYETVKEALVEQGQTFSGRLRDEFSKRFVRNQGILAADGESWKLQRRNSLKILKDFGFGRDISKEIIQNEIEDLIKLLTQYAEKGNPVDTQNLFSYCTANVISALCLNERPAYVSPKFQELLRNFDKLVQVTITDEITLFFPSIIKIPFMFQLFDLIKNRAVYTARCLEHVKEKLIEHKKDFDETQPPRDFIDAMLIQEKEAMINEPGYSKELYEFRITRTISELFVAGNDTTATMLTWMFFLLALHPHVLKRMQEEIDSVCDKNSPIKLDHKTSLPYCCAVIDEVLRHSSIVPVSLLHRTINDTKLMGYDIPSDTLVIPHLYAVHHDPNYWEQPEEFYPEHFLTADGKTHRVRDHLIPFSMGPRTCLGEQLANMETFLISTSVARKFNVSLDGNLSQQDVKELLLGKVGVVRRSGAHKLLFTLK